MQTDLGKIVMTAKGEYDSGTQYEALDTVTYNGSMYIAKQDTIRNPPTDTTYWMLGAEGNDILANELLDQIPTGTATGTTINVQDSSNLPLKNVEVLGNATQADTPTPSTPQAIHVVTGDNTVIVQGKNLIPTSASAWEQGTISNSNGGNVSNNYRIRTKDYIPITAGEYYISLQSSSYRWVNLLYYDENKNFLIAQSDITTFDGPKDTALTISRTDIKYMRATIRSSQTVSSTNIIPSEIKTAQPMVEIGSSATTFAPYQAPQTVTLPLGDIELAKIGDYKDRIFKAEVGNEFYDSLTNEQKATLSLGKWYVYKAIGKQIWNGTEDWTARYNSVYNHKMLFSTSCPHLKVDGISTRFVAVNGYTEYYPQGISFKNATDKLGLVLDDTILANYKASDLKAWLAENNTEVRYILATPTTTEITDASLISALEQLANVTTYKNVTNIFTITDDEQPTLEVVYRKDLETMFNNLNNAILSFGNNV